MRGKTPQYSWHLEYVDHTELGLVKERRNVIAE
jgi:hypothetical protein